VIGIDRTDGLKERLELAFETKATKECRPLNMGLLIDRKKHSIVVTNADNAGYASTEIMRILNQTGFRGEVLFLTNSNTYPLHLLHRLNKLALDFDLGTISMATLLNKINVNAQVPTQTQSTKLSSAVG